MPFILYLTTLHIGIMSMRTSAELPIDITNWQRVIYAADIDVTVPTESLAVERYLVKIFHRSIWNICLRCAVLLVAEAK